MSSSMVNRELFRTTICVSAIRTPASVCNEVVKSLRGSLIRRKHIRTVHDDMHDASKKVILLSETVSDAASIPAAAQTLIAQHSLEIVPRYEVQLSYENFSTEEVLRKLLPAGSDHPSSFEIVGHIAHLNLREHFYPFQNIIGQVLLDKNPSLRTVVNKLGTIDTQFREFKMDVIAGDDDFLVKDHHEQGCSFSFDYSKVYWNSRLSMEHERLVSMVPVKAVVCDMFAGVGPFAIPAARNRSCTVYANDLNPNSYEWLKENARKNKIETLVKCFNLDAREFAKHVFAERRIDADHVIMNLPASSVEFLDVFRGLFAPTKQKLPVIHCYTFARGENPESEAVKNVETLMGFPNIPNMQTHNVRDVAPNKHMICVSFPLPKEYACAHSSPSNAPLDSESTAVQEPSSKRPRSD
ncbi:mitochondrial tRNA m1G37 methyltransferase [Andalucia godoyi]|uniref:tRNA (guanine(37)-N1)-methyltransferase n=1 Tax=Andalucia godoyi TaxID=505711 RepID=A0A8K0AIJ8_ANDGO|nr:mitochondrial tRNA m1G37 methyltransferase [Andalucia godoyi]WCZ58514.1 tRNA (guanine(37)-N1)-methyltransferase [Andalucia godoyi]|eukprot:ANDGO_05353.mRNA.1 mitochondrial tRNA m1G37 methyltransferase